MWCELARDPDHWLPGGALLPHHGRDLREVVDGADKGGDHLACGLEVAPLTATRESTSFQQHR